MHIEYDTEADALYVSLRQYDGRHHARPLDDRRIVHIDDDGAPVGVELLFGAYVSYRALRPGESPPSPEVVRYAYLASLAALAVVILVGLHFVVTMLSDEPEDWWLGGGFYGGLIGSALAALFFHLARQVPTAEG